MIGTSAAAKMLGLHRSAINYAVKQGFLVPDAYTPSGQMRFDQKTIERYGARRQGRRARMGPAARAQDDAARGARFDLLRRLATELANGKDTSEICQIALAGIRQIKPDICLSVVVQHDPTDADSLHATPVASDGVTTDLLEKVSRLGRTREFAFRDALKSGETLRCDDTTTATLTPTSRLFIEELGIRSYCVVPIKVRTRTIGLLIVHSRERNAFDGVMTPFLEHVGELLAATMILHHRLAQVRRYLKLAADLMTRGVEEYAAGGVATVQRLEQLLVSMANDYCERTNAYTVICTAGPPAPGVVQDERVRDVAERAKRNRQMTIEQWDTAQGRVIGVGTHVPLGGGEFAGMAAAWREERSSWLSDYELLRVFAAACVLALSGLRHAQPPAEELDTTDPTIS